MLKKIKNFWCENRIEIIDFVTNTKQNEKQGKKKQEEIEEKIKRERKYIKIPLIMGIVYVLAGSVLLWNDNLFVAEPLNVVIGFELIVLGTFALLLTFIFYCVQGRWREKRFIKIIKEIFIFLMLPYYLCIKWIKNFIKDKRQEHVTHLFPYYLISLFIVAFLFAFVVGTLYEIGIRVVYNEFVGFIIVCCLIFTFFGCGKFFAYFLTKSIIKSVQRAEVKTTSRTNWRKTFNDEVHKKERQAKFEKEWEIVKKELGYTKIYIYIILTVLVLLIPKKNGSLTELLVNQFLGITAIAALAREAKDKTEDNLESV